MIDNPDLMAPLSQEEAISVEGGNIQYASFFFACFVAGYNYGFNVLGPLLAD